MGRDRRAGFDLRRTAFGFALIAVVVCGAGLTLRTALESAESHPVAAVVLVLLLGAGAVALLRRRRNRRLAARGAAAVVETAYEVADTVLAEAGAAASAAGVPAPRQEAADRAPEDWAGMDPYAFEEAVADLCRRDGCQEVDVVGGAGDLGADVLAVAPDGRRIVVQCKRYAPDNKVGSQDLQRFGGTCYAVHGADTALAVTTSTFTEPALEYAERCGIVCVDLEGLTAWSGGVQPPPWHTGTAAAPA
ncbi:restriction endonuclease [Streptomyces nitrosporeus]|uniref:restriction endonuclease n=1 Tax=Streptomyces nitrosporeus TaxID=28894 RepID=UPI0019C51631|nr:restriction endonuclease [Streptomyces nitrosporeus]GGZ15880.1 restriction endonuclease [Streptomyces nitrosporeus]